ncbi:hypothetical protein EJV46_21550 [Roseococcus sp. SYP-B2431]|uniref:hypothetical protein n=1 Tax=Roseococcus sp. SYP-B2431 TaxID=2496640 RepID=UPI001038CA23|nr:hypothetical protein [Roseococcus sp. SYP-B2431]TCH96169.1 hypothetical protein EJV46_21550 [Roseococcus sp. SYP-B2431]
MQQTPKNPPVSEGESKGRPDSSRERTEDQMEKGLPANQKRGPQDKSDTRPVPDQSQHDR